MPGPFDNRLAALSLASSNRAHLARMILLVVRPAILAISVLLTLADAVIDPASINPGMWGLVLGLVANQAVAMALLWAKVRPERALGIIITLDSVVFLAALQFVPQPTNVAFSLLVLVIAVSYFYSPGQTLAYTVVLAIAVTVIGPTADRWTDPTPIPASAFLILVCGLMVSLLTRQMRLIEHRLQRTLHQQHRAIVQFEQADRARERMIASVSHELRTPLTSTIGFVETLLREDIELEPAQRHDLLVRARDGGMRLLALVEDLLTVEGTTPDAISLQARRERLGDVVTAALESIEVPAGRTVQVDPDHLDGTAVLDAGRMVQVITNLVTNALHHGEGTVEIRCRSTERDVTISVLDDGPGVPAGHLRDLFQPFASFSSRADSTGLGLAISRAIVAAHGGSLTYSRTSDGRTCFAAHIPR